MIVIPNITTKTTYVARAHVCLLYCHSLFLSLPIFLFIAVGPHHIFRQRYQHTTDTQSITKQYSPVVSKWICTANIMTWGCRKKKKNCLLFWPVPNDRNLMCNNEGRFSMSACGISYPTGRICFCKIKWSSISRPLLYLWYKAAVLIINIFIAFQQFFHHRSRHWVALRGHALNGEKKAAQASCRKSWGF